MTRSYVFDAVFRFFDFPNFLCEVVFFLACLFVFLGSLRILNAHIYCVSVSRMQYALRIFISHLSCAYSSQSCIADLYCVHLLYLLHIFPVYLRIMCYLCVFLLNACVACLGCTCSLHDCMVYLYVCMFVNMLICIVSCTLLCMCI